MLALIAFAAAAHAPAALAALPDPAATEIAQLERRWGEAFVTRDFDFIEGIVAPEFRLFVARPDGGYTIARRTLWMRNGRNFRYTQVELQTVDVNRVGDTAVATVQFYNKAAMKPGETPQAHRSFLTDTWVRRHGKWQVIHRYSHRLPDAAWPPPAH